MHYLIQNDLFSQRHNEILIETLERLGLEYSSCSFCEFEGKRVLNFDTKQRRDVFVFGAVKLAHIAKEYGFLPGSMFNENHDHLVYSQYYGEYLLNYDSIIIKFGDKLPDNCPQLFFARPTKDSKFFTGQVFMHHSYDELVEAHKQGINGVKFDANVDILVSGLKNIEYEIRCWVVNGKVVTMSQYRNANRTVYKNVDEWDWLKEIVQSYVDIYQPAKAFVMDVCKIGGDIGNEIIKIVEINCINCAGFYDADLQKLLISIEEELS